MSINEIFSGSSDKREIAYTAGGVLLGVMAPLGWIILRLMLFWDDSSSLLDQVFQDIVGTEQSMYM